MKKYIYIVLLFIGMMFISACERKSVADIEKLKKARQNTEDIQVTDTKDWEYTIHNEYNEFKVGINMVPFGETAQVTSKMNEKFELTVEDVLIGDDFWDMKQLAEESDVDRLYEHIISKKDNSVLKSDGNILNMSLEGVERCALFVKIKVTNMKDKGRIAFVNLHLYNLIEKDNNKWCYCGLNEKYGGVDKFQFTDESGIYQFEANETQEFVLFYAVPKEFISQCTIEYKNGVKSARDVYTNGTNFCDVYMNSNINGSEPRFAEGQSVMKLNIEDGQVIK